MRTQSTQSINVIGTGIITVTVSLPARFYIGRAVTAAVDWALPYPFSPPWNVTIDWGDGTAPILYAGAPKPYTEMHNYANTGTFTVSAYVKHPATGADGTGTASVIISPVLAITFDANPKSGNVPLNVAFSSVVAGGYAPYSWTLDYGDGSTPGSGSLASAGSLALPAHVYSVAKMVAYTATLTVTDVLGSALSMPLSIASGLAEIPPVLENLLVVGGITLAAALLGRGVSKKRKKSMALPFGLGGAVLGIAVQRFRGRL